MRSGSGTARAGRAIKYRWFYDLLVISLMGYWGLSTLLSLTETRSVPFPVNASDPEKTHIEKPAPAKRFSDYRVILVRNLFGSAKEGTGSVKQEIVPEEVPLAEERLGLKLVGTVITGRPETNLAIIDHRRTGKQDLYHQGEQIERILIKRIVRNHVIIAMGTEEKRLTMDLEKGMAHTEMAGRLPGNPASTKIPGRREEDKPIPIQLAQQEVTSALDDTHKATAGIKLRPYKRKGDTSGGVLIRSVRPGSIFAKMGLRTGDVVTRFNEEAVTGVEETQAIYSALREGGDIALEVRRGVRTQKLQLAVE